VNDELGRVWKEGSSPTLRQYPGIYPAGTAENHKTLIQIRRFLRGYLNPGPLEYEVGVLTTRPRSSVTLPNSENLKSHCLIVFVDYLKTASPYR
jgi:hypothetical protein